MRLREAISPYMQQDKRRELMLEAGNWVLMLFVVALILFLFWTILEIKHTRETQRWPLCTMPPGGSAQPGGPSARRSPTL